MSEPGGETVECPECKGRGWLMRPTKKRARVKSKALGRAEEDAEYARLRRIFLAENKVCLVLKPRGHCGQPTTQVHHRRRRGPFYLDVSTWLATCHHCHETIERYGIWAKAMGYTHSPISIRPLPPLSKNFLPYDGPFPE